MRIRLPATRRSILHKFKIEDVTCYITVGMDATGRPLEMFLTIDDAHPTVRGLAYLLAITFSIALQSGASLDAVTSKYIYQRFPPAGFTGNPDIPNAFSIGDYIGKWLRFMFIDKKDNQGNEASAGDKRLIPVRHSGFVGAPAVAPGCPHREEDPDTQTQLNTDKNDQENRKRITMYEITHYTLDANGQRLMAHCKGAAPVVKADNLTAAERQLLGLLQGDMTRTVARPLAQGEGVSAQEIATGGDPAATATAGGGDEPTADEAAGTGTDQERKPGFIARTFGSKQE